MSHLYLPPLIDESDQIKRQTSPPSSDAIWTSYDADILKRISNDIRVSKSGKEKDISSIPDIWARPISFYNALSWDQHPKHELVKQEWRGLLSIIALHDINTDLKHTIKFSSLEISDHGVFSKALNNLCPDKEGGLKIERNVSGYAWTDIILISFGSIPLGAFCPATLIYTASDYSKDLASMRGFNFKDSNGYLKAPTLPEDNLEALGEWIYHFSLKFNDLLEKEDKKGKTAASIIKDQLKNWLDEIIKTLNTNRPQKIPDGGPINDKEYKVSEDILADFETASAPQFLEKYKIYQALLRPLIVDAENSISTDFQSETALKYERAKTGLKEVVVIEKSLLKKNLRYWRNDRPNRENPTELLTTFCTGASGSRIGQLDLNPSQAIWIRPELYFLTENLYKSKAGDFANFSEKDYNVDLEYLLPFTDRILDFFGPEEIHEKLKPRFTSKEEKVIFSFDLPIHNRESILISKEYGISGNETNKVIQITPPLISIFPKYINDNWRRYYLLTNQNDQYKYQPLFQGVEPLYENKIFTSDNKNTQNGQPTKDRINILQVTGDYSFPEAIAIKTNNEDLGLILIKKELEEKKSEENSGEKSWRVGIDFGTSNTNIHRKSSDSSIEDQTRFDFNFPLFHRTFTSTSDIDYQNQIFENFFVPNRKINLPKPTALKMYDVTQYRNLLLDYSIFYPKTYGFETNVYTNIKWDNVERKTKYFIEFLVFYILAEACYKNVQNIEFAFSYPKSFSSDDELNFYTECNEVLKKVSSGDNRMLNIKTNEADFGKLKIENKILESEGIAAGEYFANLKEDRAATQLAALCIDVGGGTSDISLWFDNNIIVDSSVKLAGGYISNYISRRFRIAELLFSQEAITALTPYRGDQTKFSSRLNLILKNEEKEIVAKLSSNSNKPEILSIRKLIALEFSAIAYYAGILCSAANKRTNNELAKKIDISGIDIHWGGNAAKLINWIDFGEYQQNGTASVFLNTIFKNAIKDPSWGEYAITSKSTENYQSKQHKEEASGGLAVIKFYDYEKRKQRRNQKSTDMDFDNQGENLDFHGVVSGEEFKTKLGEFTAVDDQVDSIIFNNNKSTIDSITMTKLKRFVGIMNMVGKAKNSLFNADNQIELPDTLLNYIQREVLSSFVGIQEEAASKRKMEPIFILEIKNLLSRIEEKL